MTITQEMHTIVVDDNGTELAYLDSGAPQLASYTTIFAVHGLSYASSVFQEILELAPSQGLRVVAISRRGYPGSTPFTDKEQNILFNGTDEQKTAFLAARGCEIARFLDIFIQRFSLPPFKHDSQSGGAVLLGWSLGAAITLATVASIDLLPDDIQLRLTTNLRSHILQEPPFIALGTPAPPQAWVPLGDDRIPLADQSPFFAQWVTGYFKHGDLSTQDPSVLSYVVPATFKAPSMFNKSSKDLQRTIHFDAGLVEGLFMANFQSQLLASYHRALFDEEVREKWMHMKVWEFIGDMTSWTSVVAYWSILDDAKSKSGDGMINFRIVNGANHFVHWDEPQLTIQLYQELLA